MVSRLRTGDLSAEVSSFVGRGREFSEIRGLLASARMVTLTGVGGVGKTRLALRAAAELRRSFPHGVWLAELAAAEDADLMFRTVSAALGVEDRSGAAPLEQLSDYLADKHLLLILDGCEQALDACGLLAGRLLAAAPGLRILATSRRPLRVRGERPLLVQPLPVSGAAGPLRGGGRSDAVRLFSDRAAAVLPGFEIEPDNRAAVLRLCRRLEGIPLAIELAAVHVRTLPVEKVAERLEHRIRLCGAGAGGACSGRDALWAAIDWSYEECSEAERALWARLSVFSEGFDLAAAQDVCAGDVVPAEQVLELVAMLVDRSLLVREGHGVHARYRQPQSVRQFGRARLAASGRAPELRRRHRDHYRQVAMRACAEWFSPRQVEWLLRLQREHANLRSAMEFSLTEPGESHGAMEIAGALRDFWMGSGLVGEGRRWLARALDTYRHPSRARARALWVSSCLALVAQDTANAKVLLNECHLLADELDDASARAYATEYSGMAAFFEGDFPRALELLNEALEAHRANDDLSGVSVTLHQLLPVASLLGDPGAAALGEECLFLCETHGAQWSRSYVLWGIALRKWRYGDHHQAGTLVRNALRLKRLFHDPWGTSLCLELLAWAAAAEGDAEHAARLLGACAATWKLSGTTLSLAPPDLAFHVECEERARRELTGEQFAAAFEQGYGFSLEEAIDYVLSRREQPPSRPPTGSWKHSEGS